MRQEETKRFGESGSQSSPQKLSLFYDAQNRFVGRGWVSEKAVVTMFPPPSRDRVMAESKTLEGTRYKWAGKAAFDVPIYAEVVNGEI